MKIKTTDDIINEHEKLKLGDGYINEDWISIEEHEAFKEKITTKLKECDSVVIETPKQRQASVYRTTILELIELLERK